MIVHNKCNSRSGLCKILFLTAREQTANLARAQQVIDCNYLETTRRVEDQNPRVSRFPGADLEDSLCSLSWEGPCKQCGVEFAYSQHFKIRSASRGQVFSESWRQLSVPVPSAA